MEPEKELRILNLISAAVKTEIRKVEIKGKQIKSLDQLKEFIFSEDVTNDELERLIWNAIGAFPHNIESDKSKLVEQMCKYLERWPISYYGERPLFMEDF